MSQLDGKGDAYLHTLTTLERILKREKDRVQVGRESLGDELFIAMYDVAEGGRTYTRELGISV